MIRDAFLLMLACFALAACDGKKASTPTSEDAKARGEIQGGTISDAMLPLDSVTSQSPPLREKAGDDAGSGGEPEDAASDPAPAAVSPDEPTDAPAPEPSASPTAETAE